MIRIDDLRAVSRAILAKVFRCSGPNINAMVSRGMPKREDGGYDLFDCVGWRLDELAMVGGSAETKEARRWLTRYRKSRALRDELQHRKEKGDLIPVDEVRLMAQVSHGEMRSALDNLEARLSGQLVGQTDRREVSRLIELEVFVLKTISARRIEFTDAAAAAVIQEFGGMSTKQARTEKIHKQEGKPNWFQWDIARRCFIDTRDNTEVAEADQAGYLKKYPCSHNFREIKNAEKN